MSEFILRRVPLLWFSVIAFFNPCDLNIARYLRAISVLYDSFSFNTISARHFEFHITRNFTLTTAVVEGSIRFFPTCIWYSVPYYHGPKICQEIMKLWNFLRECFMYSTKLTQLLWQRLVRKPLREYSGITEGYTPWKDCKSLDMQPVYVK